MCMLRAAVIQGVGGVVGTVPVVAVAMPVLAFDLAHCASLRLRQEERSHGCCWC